MRTPRTLTAATALVCAFGVGPALADTFVVDDDGVECPEFDFATIQGAVDAASVGDNIEVCDGSYDGFEVTKEEITVKAKSTPVIEGAGLVVGDQVVGVYVTADNVTIRGLTISGPYSTAIWIDGAPQGVRILSNMVDQTGFDPGALTAGEGSGIRAEAGSGDRTIIRGNTIAFGPSTKPHHGINLFDSEDLAVKYMVKKNSVEIFVATESQVAINVRATAIVMKNEITSPDKTVGTAEEVFGIWLSGPAADSAPDRVKVVKNQITMMDRAVWVSDPDSERSVIKKNDLEDNGVGVLLDGASGVIVKINDVSDSWTDGILLVAADNTKVKKNDVEGSGGDGISVSAGSSGTKVKKNEVVDSGGDGISVTGDSSGTRVKLNIVEGSGGFDLFWDETGSGNIWKKNDCVSDSPDGLCP